MVRDETLAVLKATIQAVAGGGSAIALLFGASFNAMIGWVIALMVADHVTALLGALISPLEVWELEKFLKGIAKKVALLVTFIPAAALDHAFHTTQLLEEQKFPIVAFVVVSIVIHESGSVVRNIMKAVGRLPFLQELTRHIRELGPEPGKPYGRRDTDYDGKINLPEEER